MAKSKKINLKRDLLPDNFEDLESFWEFWDQHSTVDYEDYMEPIKFNVAQLHHKSYCAIAEEIIEKARVQAQRQGISTETLINLWLQEKSTQLAT